MKLVNTLICNTKGEGEKSAEDFWIKSERLLYSALIGYIWYEAPDDEMNFTTLLEMINASEAREDDPEFQSPVDQMFERLEEKDPEHFAVRQYRKFLLSAGKTRSSILISCGARLAPFDIREVRELMEDDELELDTIGDKKTALFLIMSDTDTTFNFILAMVQSQLINLLCDRADDKYGGRLPVHVRLILDEFANIGQIPNFDKLTATIRSREISASIILQSQSQLKAIYKDAAEIISDNCDCTLFLSGRGKNAKEIAEVLGKETIDSYNQSENRGAQTSHGLNYQKLGKDWHYEKVLAANKDRFGKMWECPDFFSLDGKWVLLVSPQDMLPSGFEYHNGNGTLCLIGSYDKETQEFTEEADQAADYGIDFYAHQTILTPDGRRVMIGWMQNWDTCNHRRRHDEVWFGQMSLPRELSIKNGRLYQKPIRELEEMRQNKVAYENVTVSGMVKLEGIKGRRVDMELAIRPEEGCDLYRKFAVRFAQNDSYHTSLSFRPGESVLKVDRKFSGSRRAIIHQRRSKVSHDGGKLKLRIILDRFSVEVFVNDGEQTMSAVLYTDQAADGISFIADGTVNLDVVKYDLV